MLLNWVLVLITFIAFHVYYFHGELVFHLERIFDQNDLTNNSTFDYIVVGSGTAGSKIAQGLQNASVLLVEAGGFGSIFFDIPVSLALLQRTSYDWKYVTMPQKHACKGLKNQQSFWPMGKIVGGTHKFNNLIHHEGHPSDYEDLIELDRNEYQDIPVEQTVIKTKFADAFVKAGQEMGFEDFSYTNLTLSHGKRMTFGHQLRESRKRKITKFSQVTRILFDDRKRAVGVEIHKGKYFYQINARKGVILSAGAIGTPKILMLSGIGPKEDLKKLNIPVVADLPVGKNLQDHIVTGFNLILLNQSLGVDMKDFFHPREIFNYFSSSGPSKFSFSGCDAMGFVSLNPVKSKVPDLSFMVIPNGITSDYGLAFRHSVNLNDSVWEKYFQPLIDQHSTTILPVLLHPKSRGTIKLQSNDFRDPPIINPNYLEYPDDVRKMISGIRIIQSLLSTKAMESLGVELNPKPLPGCDDIEFNSDQYWECYIRHLTLTMYHPVGTCSMGNPADETTVVLKDFSVKNVANLFIVDGSVLPNTPSGNPNGVIAMFARKFLEIVNK